MRSGSVFGPINMKGLVHWASDGRILPDDEVSTDRKNWSSASELIELKMDMMIEQPDGTFIGPFNAQAIEPLIQGGKIPPESKPFPIEEFEARKAVRQEPLSAASRSAVTEVVRDDEIELVEEERDRMQIVAEKQTLEKKLAEQETASRDESERVQKKLDAVVARCTELQKEYNELLAFSNARDGKGKEKIHLLEAELTQLKDSLEERRLVPVRRLESLESQMGEVLSERDHLKDQLTEAVAKQAIAAQPTEGDIALIKLFSGGALEMMRKTLELEKKRNTAARAASAELQDMIHTEIERLERVRARDPGEISRAEKMGQRSEHQIAKLQQELESVRRHHQADMARAEANEKAMNARFKAVIQREALLRENLSRVEQRTAEYDSLSSQLQRKESALLTAEKEFEEARQQWQIIESTLQHRIEELERGAGLLFDSNGKERSADTREANADTDSKSFRVEPWMRRMKRK